MKQISEWVDLFFLYVQFHGDGCYLSFYFFPKQISILIDLNKMTQYFLTVENNGIGQVTRKIHPKFWKQWNVKATTANYLELHSKAGFNKVKNETLSKFKM